MAQNYDVIIIGGGIIGNSISAHLANENLKIAVVSTNTLGTPASIAAAGLLTPFQLNEYENPLLKNFCLKSFEYFLSFYELIKSETNTNLGFNKSGSLYVIFSNLEIAQKESELKEVKNIARVSFLNKIEIPKYEPQVTKDTLGAYHYADEGFINNPKFLKAISNYCVERKVSYINYEVTEINIKNDHIESIHLSNGETISAKKYVLSNGTWANKFLRKLFNIDENLIKGIKGEMLQVEAIQELSLLQKILFCKEGYILPRPATNQFEKPSILVGSTSTEVNVEDEKDVFQNTTSGISSLLNLLQKLLPAYKNSQILNTWSGIRPQTKDKLPILGGLEEIENLYLALGHYRNGILMGPLTGKITKDLILGNESEYNIDSFKAERFFKTSKTLTPALP